MILADTSIWIDHLRTQDPVFRQMLNETKVSMHPFVIGEVALGSIRNRSQVLQEMMDMPQAVVASGEEVRHLIEWQSLHGTGIGYGDAQLLASTRLTSGLRLWTRDKRLKAQAERLGIGYQGH